jgi:hypothetical protein
MVGNVPNPNRLHKQLARLIALETAIEQKLQELLPAASEYAEASALLSGFQTLPKDQRKALEARLHILTEGAPQVNAPAMSSVAGSLSDGEEYPVSTALQIVHAMLNHAVISYSMLTPMGTRFLDSPWSAKEGTSFHLAKQHMENYAHAIQQISRLLHDVLLWELDHDGYECQCQCPSCAAGVCLCSMAGRLHMNRAWEAAGPFWEDGAITVQLPKHDSVAARAGLQKGDVIVAVGGQKIDSFDLLQDAIGNAEPGDEVQLTVWRKSEEAEDAVTLRL